MYMRSAKYSLFNAIKFPRDDCGEFLYFMRFGTEENMITSHANKGVREAAQLNRQAKARREQGLFVAEGVKMFLEAPMGRIVKTYVSESFLPQASAACRDKLAALKQSYETVSDEVFGKMSDTKTPQGILCLVRQVSYSLETMLGVKRPLLVLLEDIQDPGNLGTIFRAGEGAGVTGIIMSGNTVDLYNPKTIRSTMGSVYRMPFLYVPDLEAAIGLLQDAGVAVYAAHPQNAGDYDCRSYLEGTAFLIGNEGNGLRESTRKKADASVSIPMAGQVESLNAAMAASILMYEAARQRRKG